MKPLNKFNTLLSLGTKTQWGKVKMVGFTGGERYYWMVDKYNCVSMMPAFMVEKQSKIKNNDTRPEFC